MKKLRAFLLLLILSIAGLGLYVRRELQVAGTPAEGLIIEIPHGLPAREIAGLLKQKKVIQNSNVASAYILYRGTRNKLQPRDHSLEHPEPTPEAAHRLPHGPASPPTLPLPPRLPP